VLGLVSLLLLARGDTAMPGGLHARLCHALSIVLRRMSTRVQHTINN